MFHVRNTNHLTWRALLAALIYMPPTKFKKVTKIFLLHLNQVGANFIMCHTAAKNIFAV